MDNLKIKKVGLYLLMVFAFIANMVLYNVIDVLKTEDKSVAVSLLNNTGISPGIFFLIFAVFMISILFCSVIWIMMLVHAASKNIENKALWVVALIFGGIFSGVLYYFLVKKNFKDSSVNVEINN